MIELGLCPKCLEITELTKHHILPKRYFKKKNDYMVLHICRKCHDILEIIIKKKEKYNELSKEEYIGIAQQFIGSH